MFSNFFCDFFKFFVNVIPYGSKNFKTLFLPQISFNLHSFKLFLNFLLSGLTKVLFWILEILSDFSRSFSFSFTWDHKGAKTPNAAPPSNHF